MAASDTPRTDALLQAWREWSKKYDRFCNPPLCTYVPFPTQPPTLEEHARALERELAERVSYVEGLKRTVETVATYLEGCADPANPDDPDNWVLSPAKALRDALAKNPATPNASSGPDGLAAYDAVTEIGLELPPDAACKLIEDALLSYRCTYTRDGERHEEVGLPLVDMLTPPQDGKITRGLEELSLLAEHLFDTLPALRADPVSGVGTAPK